MPTMRAKRPNTRKSLAVMLALATIALARTSTAQANTLTVCASGCNYTTIAAALGAAVSGDTISILDALHKENGIQIGATAAQNVTIQGQGATATVVDGGGVGPIFSVDSGTVTIQNLTVQNGSDTADGGGIVNWGTLTLSNCLVTNNSTTSGSNGGGLANLGGVVTIDNCTFSSNTAASFGGGIANTSSGTLQITSSTLSANHANSGDGGGLVNLSGTVTILNSTISGNGAAIGAGIENFAALTIGSSTVASNTATSAGGGIDTSSTGTTTIKNSIVGDNGGSDCIGTGVMAALGANLDTDGTCRATNFTQTSSLDLGVLALNPPGSTETQALLPGSAAIDNAKDCTDAFGNPVTVDQRGVPRPQGLYCDIGAFEAQPQATSAVNDQIDLGLLTNPNDTAAGASVTMGAFVHDKATVATTVDPIPSGSSVTFKVFPTADCSGAQSPTHTVNLNGGAMSESAESSGTANVAADGPLPVGAIAYTAAFTSGNSLVPNSASGCTALNVTSPISQFFYNLPGDPSIYNCAVATLGGNCPTGTLEATVAAGTTNSYTVTVGLTNQSGLAVTENVLGSLAAGKSISIGTPSTTCGSAVVKHNGQVVWNASGSNSPKAAGFSMAPGAICTLTVTVTAAFGAGQQGVTGSWSTTQSEVSAVTNQSVTLTSPLTGSLAVAVQ